MFDIGWTEMLVIAVVMIVVVGPKDLPRMLRTFGKTTAKLRSMAGDFQKQFNEALKEAELDDIKESVDSLRKLNPTSEIRKQLNPFEKAASDLRSGLDNAMKPKPDSSAAPADAAAHPAEPLKNGATEMPPMPQFDGPSEMPTPPVFADTSAKPAAGEPRAAAPLKKASASGAGNGSAKPVARADAVKSPKTAAARPAPKPATKAAVSKAAKAPAKPAAKKPSPTRKSPGKST